MSATDNAEFRLALFPPSDGGAARPYLKRQEIYRTDGIVVLYSGQRLDPADLGVYLQLVGLADRSPGGEARFSIDALLKAVGRKPNQAEWLHGTIIRLCGAVLEIKRGEGNYFGGLLKGGTLDPQTGAYAVSVDMKLACFVVSGIWSGAEDTRWQAPKPGVRGLLN